MDESETGARGPRAGGAAGVVIREVTCRTILNRTRISDYSLNCYTGCAHGCVYCYARFMQRFHPHPEPWGAFVDVKINAVEALKRQLRRARPGEVFVSSACDGWQPIEAERELTRECCRLLLDGGFRVSVLTKSALVERDLDLFVGRSARVGVTLTTLDEDLRKVWEPGSSSVEERLGVLAGARKAGAETSIMFGPLLPHLSDDASSIDEMFQTAADLWVDTIWVDALNPRPKVWPSVAALLRRRFPDLLEPYRSVLYHPNARREYLDRLHGRMTRAAKKHALSDRVRGAFE